MATVAAAPIALLPAGRGRHRKPGRAAMPLTVRSTSAIPTAPTTPGLPAIAAPPVIPANLVTPEAVTPSITLLPAQRTLRSPRTGINPRPVRRLQRVTNWLVNLISVLASLVFLGLAVGPHVLGYHTETMLTGSMAPQIKVGDVVVVTDTPLAQIKSGDVVSYAIPVEDHRVVSHRVVTITTNPDGTSTIQTKGDANAGNDPWTATIPGGHIWQVRAVIPKVGTAIRFLRDPDVAHFLRIGAPIGFVLLSLGSIWRSSDKHRRPQ
jgi:signal peptidase